MTKDEKIEIDNMSYLEMLRKWRFTPLADNYFVGERGEYFRKIMFEKKEKLSPEEQVSVSKRIGW